MTEGKTGQNIQTINALQAQLEQAGIPVEKFGTGEAKTLEHLFKEVQSGETLLIQDDKRLLRQVSTAALNVTHTKDGEQLVLIEDKQVFKDGRTRRRDFDWSIAEKLAPGEKPVDAARRALKEELDINQKTLVKGQVKEKERTSPSYPGLTSRYTTHYFSVELSDGQFKPEGYSEQQSDKTTYWVWKKV